MTSVTYSIDPAAAGIRIDYSGPLSGLPSALSGFYGLPSTPKASADTATKPTPDSIIKDIHQIAKEDGADLKEIKDAVEAAEKKHRDRIETALKGVADLELLKGTKARRFVAVYWDGDEAKMAQGVEYPVELNEDDEPIGASVIVNDIGHPFSCRHKTIETFREILAEDGPYHIAYFDEK